MLALRVEQDRRGLDEVDCLQKEATTIQQGWQSGRPALHKQRINIREKISQWESRSQQSSSQDAGFKVHPPLVSRTLSGDLLGNGGSNKTYGVGNHARDRAKSTELDFREPPAHNVHSVAGRKSEPLKKFPTPFLTASPGKNSTTQTFASSELEVDTLSSAESVFSAHVDSKVDCIPDILIVSKPQPPSAGDQEDNMPAGNFYTSRGFWRKLEGDRLLWENGRSNAGESRPPPKPLRTFQYCGTHNMKHAVHLDSRSPQNNNHSNLRSRRVVKPPNFPPPPCPVIKSEGLSRHKKNRKSFEYEDAANLTAQQGTVGNGDVHPNLYHAYSDDNIYEDIVCEGSRDYPYEDVKLSTMCLPAKPPVPKKLQNQQHLVTRAVRKFTGLRRCSHAVLALLYPFTWQHTFVPVLPASMLDISCSPTPFLIGVLAPCLPELLELPIEEVHQQADLSSLVSEGFVRFFVELVGHYPLHMVESSNGTKELQRESFRKSHPSRGARQFLQLFMDTQMFAGFIQDKELRKGGGKQGKRFSLGRIYFMVWC
ncbi:hypothetical protein GOODEAATRI_004993 [Goodea atripinnis]|uniref:UDENN domain-containing protein n=1 Tax=Goodea atripinnis TaxID=208336 RepID=A0ABV0MYS4_9TELE